MQRVEILLSMHDETQVMKRERRQVYGSLLGGDEEIREVQGMRR